MSKFNVGDVVYLNSGSPAMTVKEINHPDYWCSWVKSDGATESDKFNEACITKEIRRL